MKARVRETMTIKQLNDRLLEEAERYLFPDGNYEDKFKQGEIRNDYFKSREYKIRFALPADIESLMQMEASCWATPLQTSRSEIKQRLVDPACFTFVLEL